MLAVTGELSGYQGEMHDQEKLRADAKMNRDRLLEVARHALARDPEASLNSIAKAAGVGAGTLYRHFPSREALVLGVYHKEIQALVELAPKLTAAYRPLKAFQRWCRRLARYGRIKHGLGETLHAAMTDRDYQQSYGPIIGAIDHLLKTCETSGDIHSNARADDVLLMLGFLWRIKPGPDAEPQADRLLEIVIRGLSKAAPSSERDHRRWRKR
jgi:AcrR family transcriptional regulator